MGASLWECFWLYRKLGKSQRSFKQYEETVKTLDDRKLIGLSFVFIMFSDKNSLVFWKGWHSRARRSMFWSIPGCRNDCTLLTSCVQSYNLLKIGCPRDDGTTARSLHIKKTVLYKKLLLADKVRLELVISTGKDRPTILCKQLPWPIKGFWKFPWRSLWQRSEVA